MNRDEAATVLGVKLQGLTLNDVSVAFARAVKLAHPDTGGSREGSIEAIDKAQKARDTLRDLVEKGGVPKACGSCNGSGRIRNALTGFGTVVCPRCGGRGHA